MRYQKWPFYEQFFSPNKNLWFEPQRQVNLTETIIYKIQKAKEKSLQNQSDKTRRCIPIMYINTFGFYKSKI